MPSRHHDQPKLRRWLWLAPLLFAVAGFSFGAAYPHNPLRMFENGPPSSRQFILSPHVRPRTPNSSGLRLAMVHDVIHERYLKHGPAFYRDRNRTIEANVNRTLAGELKPTLTSLGEIDDYAVGWERLGESGRAADIMRRKLDLQRKHGIPPISASSTFKDRPEGEPVPPDEEALYKTYANLGTFLIHDSARRAISGDQGAQSQMREGLDCIRKSIALNPVAHFGREEWQWIIGSFLLAAMERPELLTKYDCVGNALHESWDQLGPIGLTTGPPEDGRQALRTVGIEREWAEAVGGRHRHPVPFDEPTLGILGMWTMGGGANPHFALALGEIMVRAGRFSTAWRAYERALGMTDSLWPDPKVRESFSNHCRRRQSQIQSVMNWTEDQVQAERQRFQDELTFGQDAQKTYQDTVESRIRQNASIKDPWDRASAAEPAGLASPVGNADNAWVRSRDPRLGDVALNALPPAAIGASLGFLLAVAARLRKRSCPDPNSAKQETIDLASRSSNPPCPP